MKGIKMLDNLKDYIDGEREDFEIYPFDGAKGWSEGSKKMLSSKKWPLWKKASIVACFLLVMLGTIYQADTKENPSALAELNTYYQVEINHKVNLIKSHLDDVSVLKDLELIDQAFAELKSDLQENVDNEEVILAMMENYQLKLRILEEILNRLEKEGNASNL
ncbi:MAG: hypothetical protein AAGC64_01745 [Bacteroidota bacterium]